MEKFHLSKTVLLFLIFTNSFGVSSQEIDPEGYALIMVGDSLFSSKEYVLAANWYMKALEKKVLNLSTVNYGISKAYYQAYQDSLAKHYMVKAINHGLAFWDVEGLKRDTRILNHLDGDKNELERLLQNSYRFRYSDSLCIYTEIRNELIKRREEDQRYRKVGNNLPKDWEKQMEIDSLNVVFLDSVMDVLGKWPGYREVGEEGSSIAALFAIHTLDTTFQKKVLMEMEEAIRQNNIFFGDYALLMDKFWLRFSGKQIFGTQITYNNEFKKVSIENLKYPSYLDTLRKYFLLIPIKEYIQHMEKVNLNK